MANLNINKIVLGGRLTADPELKSTQNGVAVTSFTVAVNRRFKSADGTQEVDFVNCTAWRQAAELVCKYFKKGSSICVTGTLQNRKWTDKEGATRYATDVVCDEIYFVDSKADAERKDAHPGLPGQFTGAELDRYTATKREPENVPDDEGLPF